MKTIVDNMPHRLAALLVYLVAICGAASLVAAEPAKKANPAAPSAKQAAPKPVAASAAGELDLNKDGVVTDEEAREASARLQKEAAKEARSERGKDIIAAFDKNKNGKLDSDEAQAGVAQARAVAPGAGPKVAEMFNKLDLDGNGFLTNPEFLSLVKQLGPVGIAVAPRLAEFFNNLDANRDGAISFAESQMLADHLNRQVLNGGDPPANDKPDPRVVQQVNAALAALDRNNDGAISEVESRKDKNLKQVFLFIDKNLDKKATADELYIYLRTRAAEEKKN